MQVTDIHNLKISPLALTSDANEKISERYELIMLLMLILIELES